MFKCKKCGNEVEFYTKERYKGTCNVFFRLDGKDPDNSEMYDYADHTYRSKFIFCSNCNSRVALIEDLKNLDV